MGEEPLGEEPLGGGAFGGRQGQKPAPLVVPVRFPLHSFPLILRFTQQQDLGVVPTSCSHTLEEPYPNH